MAAITSLQKSRLNKQNQASKDVLMGDRVNTMVFGGSHVVTTAQMSASAVTVYNALATGGMYMFDVTTSGSVRAKEGNFFALRSGGSLTINPYNSGSLAVGDVVHYILA